VLALVAAVAAVCLRLLVSPRGKWSAAVSAAGGEVMP
jgi:hypothetical protein